MALAGGQRGTLTLEKGADLPPGCHTALAGVLAQCHLQEEHWDTAGEEEDEVGDEEGSCGRRGAGAESSREPRPAPWQPVSLPTLPGACVGLLLSATRDRQKFSSLNPTGDRKDL